MNNQCIFILSIQSLSIIRLNLNTNTIKSNYNSLERKTQNTLPYQLYHNDVKENRPPQNRFFHQHPNSSKSHSGTRDDSKRSALSKQEIINRIKRLNQNQNDKNVLNCKYITNNDNASHQRYKSSVTRNTSITFHQLLSEYTSCSGRIKSKNIVPNTSNCGLNSKKNRCSPIIEEVPQNKKSKLTKKEKSVQMDHLLLQLQLKKKSIQQKNQVQDQSRNRIKESVFYYKSNEPQHYQKQPPQPPNNEKFEDKQFLGQNAFDNLKKSLDNMCSLSQQQLFLMNQTKSELNPYKYDNSMQNNNNESLVQLDLTCDDQEEVKVIEEAVPPQNIPDDDDSNSDGIIYMIERERQYLPDPHYLENCQKDITWNMRAILIDWMMEVSSEFHFKRETFYLSTYYVDLFLSKQIVEKQNLQLIGLTAMFMAQKMEEVIPRKVSDFARAADFGYSVEEILQMELEILRSTKWKVNPPTLNLWLNWYMSQWDLFNNQKHSSLGKFKNSSEESYQLFKTLTQLIDCCILDIETLQYQPRTVVASFMYLVIALRSQIFTLEMIEQMKDSSLFLLDQNNQFNVMFAEFTQITFGFNLIDLLPIIQYASTFFKLQINFESPPGVATLPNTQLESNYEEFLSFQCHTSQNLAYAKHRPRDEIY